MITSPHRYFIIHKPYNMVSQFVSPHKVKLLGDLDYKFPEGTHAVGRLDQNSEGLLILTTNKKITSLLFQSEKPHKRTYLVQTKNAISEEAIGRLRSGVSIRIKGGEQYLTSPCEVSLVNEQHLSTSIIKDKKSLPGTWLSITLTEGKYHQVRKMIAAVRHRCRRLIRISIDEIKLRICRQAPFRKLKKKIFLVRSELFKRKLLCLMFLS